MKLTNAEKLILTMLVDVHEKLGIDDDDTNLIKKSIYSNNTWALSWALRGIVGDSDEPTPPEVIFVQDVLDMWSFIEEAYDRFNANDKAHLEANAAPFGKHVKFSGFDGNSESEHLSIASFLVNDMNHFTRFAGRDLNSHVPSIGGYQRMLAKFSEIRHMLDGRGMSVEEVVEVLNARRHPDF